MENVYLIAGLGNPGSEYSGTRHNAGFLVLEEVSRRWNLSWKNEKKFKAECSEGQVDGRRVMVCRPKTFMNASGESVGTIARYLRVELDKILVVVDDADLPFGELRLRPGGSSGGHHGLVSIEEHLETRQFARLRVGIGREGEGVRDITGYVLEKFSQAERPKLTLVLARAADQVECWVTQGVARAMNDFNGAVKAPHGKG